MGAHIRLLISTIPIIIYLTYLRNEKIKNIKLDILFKFYVLFVLLISPFIGFASIVVDRLLYTLFILGCLVVNCSLEISKNNNKKIIFYFSQIFIFLILFVYFNFSIHAKFWYPYKNIVLF